MHIDINIYIYIYFANILPNLRNRKCQRCLKRKGSKHVETGALRLPPKAGLRWLSSERFHRPRHDAFPRAEALRQGEHSNRPWNHIPRTSCHILPCFKVCLNGPEWKQLMRRWTKRQKASKNIKKNVGKKKSKNRKRQAAFEDVLYCRMMRCPTRLSWRMYSLRDSAWLTIAVNWSWVHNGGQHVWLVWVFLASTALVN